MGFETEGFLGKDAECLVGKQRIEFQDLFEFAQDCSAMAMKLNSLPNSTDNFGVSIGVMFARCIAQFQGAIILAERGLSIESMVLTRALFETDFVLGALVSKTVTPEELVDSDLGSRRRIGNALLPISKADSHVEHHAKLKAFIIDNAESKSLAFETIAKRAGMQTVYDGPYRFLSHFAAHPTITAASEYFVRQPNGHEYVRFHPLVSNTSKAVTFACTGIILGCGTYENKVHQTQELNTELKLLLDREEALYQKYRPLDLNDEDESNK